MIDKFKIELARLFFLISIVIVIIIGLISKIPVDVLFLRVIIGGTIFTLFGYLIGMVLDNEQEKKEIENQKRFLKSQLKNRYDEEIENRASSAEDFEPLDMDSLAKIVVDSLEG